MKVAGLLCAVVLAPSLVACGSQSATAGGFNPDPAFPVGPISDMASHQIPKLDHVASTLAGKHATVNCWSNRDWAREQAWQGDHHNKRGVDANGSPTPTTGSSCRRSSVRFWRRSSQGLPDSRCSRPGL